MERKPYIGITGLERQEQTASLSDSFVPLANYDLMIGVLVSSKSAFGIPTKYPHRYPRAEDVSNIFLPEQGILNLIHYSTDERDHLLAQMATVSDFGYPFCNGFQLNMVWPELRAVVSYKDFEPEHVLVLQCGSRALSVLGIDIRELPQKKDIDILAEQIIGYGDVIDYILLDMSGGRGKLLNVPFTRAYLEGLYAKRLYPKIGIAGGLSAETLPGVAELFREFPGLSIDAEGGLRAADDHLDLPKAIAYLRKAAQYLS